MHLPQIGSGVNLWALYSYMQICDANSGMYILYNNSKLLLHVLSSDLLWLQAPLRKPWNGFLCHTCWAVLCSFCRCGWPDGARMMRGCFNTCPALQEASPPRSSSGSMMHSVLHITDTASGISPIFLTICLQDYIISSVVML